MGDVVQFRPRAAPTARVEAGPLPPNAKRDVLLRLMDAGVAMVHLDARKPGVVVPAAHAKDFDLRLNFSWKFRIGDMNIGAEKIVASLSFAGRPFRCEVPWSAVYAVTPSGRIDSSAGEIFLADLPDELGKPA